MEQTDIDTWKRAWKDRWNFDVNLLKHGNGLLVQVPEFIEGASVYEEWAHLLCSIKDSIGTDKNLKPIKFYVGNRELNIDSPDPEFKRTIDNFVRVQGRFKSWLSQFTTGPAALPVSRDIPCDFVSNQFFNEHPDIGRHSGYRNEIMYYLWRTYNQRIPVYQWQELFKIAPSDLINVEDPENHNQLAYLVAKVLDADTFACALWGAAIPKTNYIIHRSQVYGHTPADRVDPKHHAQWQQFIDDQKILRRLLGKE